MQSVFPYKRVFTKYELTLVSNCINIQIQGGFVKKNYMELLEPFKEAGENKGPAAVGNAGDIRTGCRDEQWENS